jgi:hypothetical protein
MSDDIDRIIDEIDGWLTRRADRLSNQANRHLRKNGDVYDPDYRAALGEHRGYLAVRSYIHGVVRARLLEREGGKPVTSLKRMQRERMAAGGCRVCSM